MREAKKKEPRSELRRCLTCKLRESCLFGENAAENISRGYTYVPGSVCYHTNGGRLMKSN